VTLHSAKLLEIPTRLTQNVAILIDCCNWHLLYRQNVKVQLSLTTQAISTVTAVTAGWSFILGLCSWWLSASRSGCLPPDQLNITFGRFLFLFACCWQYKSLLPLFHIELSFLAVATCSPVTVLRLTQLNSSNGRTASIFQVLLIAQESSGWRQQQLLTCCFVQVFEFGTWKPSEKTDYKNVRIFSPYFVFTSQQQVRTFFSISESAFCAVQFTVSVILGFTFHKTSEFREISGGFAIDEPPRGSMNEPVDCSQNWGFRYRLTALYKLFRLLFECSHSTSVFTSYCIIMCNWHGVPSENLVVTQGTEESFFISNTTCRNLLNTEILRLKMCRYTLETAVFV